MHVIGMEPVELEVFICFDRFEKSYQVANPTKTKDRNNKE